MSYVAADSVHAQWDNQHKPLPNLISLIAKEPDIGILDCNWYYNLLIKKLCLRENTWYDVNNLVI